MERRIFQAGEIRAAKEEGGIRVSGFAAVYGAISSDLGGFKERIQPGAFAPALKRSDVRFLLNHEGLPLARFRGQDGDTLELEDRAEGLWFTTLLAPEDPDVQRLVPKLERGDLDQMSFAFKLPKDGAGEEWSRGEDKSRLRDITEFREVADVSPVTYPAYVDTSVALRSMAQITEKTHPKSLEIRRRELDLRQRLALG